MRRFMRLGEHVLQKSEEEGLEINMMDTDFVSAGRRQQAVSEDEEPESYLELTADAPRDKRIALKDKTNQ